MLNYHINDGHKLRVVIGIVFGLTILLLLAGSGTAAVSVNKLEVRGTVADANADPNLAPIWHANSFPGFFFYIKNNLTTERLSIETTLANLQNTRTIPEKALIYMTGSVPIDFKVFEKEGLYVTNTSGQSVTNYSVVGWQGEKWVAINNVANKLVKLAYEMDKEDKKTLTKGETWSLGAGYELTINGIDAMTTPRQVRFTLKKDGVIIDEGIGQAPASGYPAGKQNAVYFKTKTILGESDALLFTVYVESIFSGAPSEMVQFKYAWLIDESSAKEIQVSDEFGIFEVTAADNNMIIMDNKNTVSLSKNTETTLMGNFKFVIADSDVLRFYPQVTYTAPGTYELRGTVWNQGDEVEAASWNYQKFSGFYYDLKNNRTTEQLTFLTTPTRSNPESSIQYTTGAVPVDFKVFEKEGLYVKNTPGSPATNYSVVVWQGEKFVAINGVANKLAKLVLEMGAQDNKTLAIGETWSLGAGYELTIKGIDAITTPRQVWFTLKKDGAVIDEGIGQAPTSSGKQPAVYYKTTTILGEQDALLFTVLINNISTDKVEFKYGWLIDASSANEINAGDVFGIFEVRGVNPFISMTNKNAVSLSKNTEITLMGNLKFRIIDNSSVLRFYPKVDYVIPEGAIPPSSLSISINNGDAYTSSTSVTLSLSAINATEMSFSNDIISWSPWEPFATTKSWTLTSGDGLKTVILK